MKAYSSTTIILSGFLFLQTDGCGRPAISPVIKIVGGDEAIQGSWPWQVNILHRKQGWAGIELEFICGGSILNERFILTAAHCIDQDLTASKYIVRAGDHDRTITEESESVGEVKRLILHPDYNALTVDNDIALIELETPLILSDKISSVCLPAIGSDPPIGTLGVATGWGDTEVTPWEGLGRIAVAQKGQSTVLNQVQLKVISRSVCSEDFYSGLITEQMICAGFDEGGKDPCQADSGGPLVSPNSADAYEVIGITSWGHGCGLARRPGVYTRVGSFVEWILENSG